ncbi:zinc metalloprotease egy2 chloroplastic [Dionaea muscipula]
MLEMSSSAALRGKFYSSQCASCSDHLSQPLIASSSFRGDGRFWQRHLQHCHASRLGIRRRIEVRCRVSDTEIEPERDEDKEQESYRGEEGTSSSDVDVSNNSPFGSEKQEVVANEIVDSSKSSILSDDNNEIAIQGAAQVL